MNRLIGGSMPRTPLLSYLMKALGFGVKVLEFG